MNFFLMGRLVKSDATGLYRRSHRFTPTKTGELFPTEFEGPFIAELDSDNVNGSFPTFYESPAVIGKKEFYQDLREIGIDNIEVHDVEIRDKVNNKTIGGYLLLNIIGRVNCAVLDQSDLKTLGPGMNVIDDLVIDTSKIPSGLDLFLEANDTDNIIISERVYNHLQGKGYTDIYFEKLQAI